MRLYILARILVTKPETHLCGTRTILGACCLPQAGTPLSRNTRLIQTSGGGSSRICSQTRRQRGLHHRLKKFARNAPWRARNASGLATHSGSVPTFRSSCSIAAPTFTNFGKSWALANLLILVPLFYLKFLYRIRGSWCRNFK